MKLHLVIIGLCFLFALTSCQTEDLVDDTFEIYLLRFQEEGLERNIIVDYENTPVEVRLQSHPDNISLGWCIYSSDSPNVITINQTFWDIHDDLGKEKIIFHELGHCILNRPHLDEIMVNGFCRSIMHSGQACADNYKAETREQYLDELFTRR